MSQRHLVDAKSAQTMHIVDTEEFVIEEGAGQGRKAFPRIFIWIVRAATAKLSKDWEMRRLGFTYDKDRPPIAKIWWADNLFLLSSTKLGMMTMLKEMTEAIMAPLWRLRWKKASLKIIFRPPMGRTRT